MARQIGKMLNAREPKIVNGPQILDKYVGESEANIRRLFADAEEEEKRMGPNSGEKTLLYLFSPKILSNTIYYYCNVYKKDTQNSQYV
jgi:SpoVK/Ycf46/Vps4 family AAA+-type ATPase